jgi:hypothetical protein
LSTIASTDEYPVRRRDLILGTLGSNVLRKYSPLLILDTVMSTASGTAPARSRHRGTNRFHAVANDAQFLGLKLMTLRQYRQTWVKDTIGLGSAGETKVAQDARTSGGRRFTGRSAFFRVNTSRNTALACFSRMSICKRSLSISSVLSLIPGS